MGGCSILGCKSHSSRKNGDITFHSFPKDTHMGNIWIKATGRLNWHPGKTSKICSIHFEEDAINTSNKIKRLKPHAVPLKHIHIISMEETSNQVFAVSAYSNIDSTSHESIDHFIFDMRQPSTSQLPTTPTRKKKINQIKSLIIQPKELCMTMQSTPKKEMLKKKILKLKQQSTARLKRLRAARETTRRLKKRNVHLEHILDDLKRKLKIGYEQLDVLANIGSGNFRV